MAEHPTPHFGPRTWRFSGELNIPTLITMASVAIAVAMWAGSVNTTIETIDARLTTLEQRNVSTPERMAKIEAYAENNATALNRIEQRLEQLERTGR